MTKRTRVPKEKKEEGPIYKAVPVNLIDPWNKNPRGIKTEDYDRLKRQIEELGVYKPLVVCEEGGRYIVLGGNMRIRAIKELGVATVAVSIVDAPTDAERLKYALSDNDRAGFYENEVLAEMALEHADALDLDLFKIDVGGQQPLSEVIAEFGPPEEEGKFEVPEVFNVDIDFKFGDYQARVPRPIYDSFVEQLKKMRGSSEAVTIGDVLTKWLKI